MRVEKYIYLLLAETTSDWLKNNGVKYHRLMFGKPNGDYYIDDKNLSIKEFLEL